MSKHLWLVTTFTDDTVKRGAEIAFFAVNKHLDYRRTCQFIGYVLESQRQAGWKAGTVSSYEAWTRRATSPLAEWMWKQVEKSKHRYLRGRNADNYFIGGEKIMAVISTEFGFLERVPPTVMFDFLCERRDGA